MKKLMMTVACVAMATMATAQRTVDYIDDRGQKKSADNVSVITAETGPLVDGWYLAEGDLTRGSLKVAGGNVNLILADGAVLKVTGEKNEGGIDVAGNKALYIYAQQEGTGQLVAKGGQRGAGIGTGGCTWDDYGPGALARGGNITIYGGIVRATGGADAAGIGGGRYHQSGVITINGGNVTAQGGDNGAGIGGGLYGYGEVIINGGTVSATGGKIGTGIGGGRDVSTSPASKVKITGGEVTAQGGTDGAGIGGDSSSNTADKWRCTVEITGGKVTATAGPGSTNRGGGAGIGGGGSKYGAVVTITGGEVTAEGKLGGAGIGGGNGLDGCTVTISGGTVTATGGSTGAGIGGGRYGNGGKVTINGGIVTATSAGSGAGIGGGREDAGADVTINGGTVTASSESGMGIGAGKPASGAPWPEKGSTQINGGNVKASSVSASAIQIQPKNKSGQSVYRVTATLPGGTDATKKVAISRLSGYDTKDIYPLDGNMLYLYLPNNNYDFTANDTRYTATVAGAECEAESSYCKVTVAEGGLRYMTAVWTSGDETVSNAVENGFFFVQVGTKGVKVIFTPDEGYELKGETVVNLDAVTENVVFGKGNEYCVPRAAGLHRDISYLDWDAGNGRMTEKTLASASDYEFVDETTRTLEDGKWYVVATDVVIDDGRSLAVNGSAHLILMDGAFLRVANVADDSSAIDISEGGSLTICAQSGGTGWLSATGNGTGAGIGGSGALTINGGSITAAGGKTGKGIGCATVTINGGNVKASSITEQPQNAMEQDVYCVTVDVAGLGSDGLMVEGLEGCGIGAVLPIEGMLYLYLPDGGYEFSVDGVECIADVAGEAATATRCKTLPENVTFETFEDGLHFVESSGGAYINTRYHPTPNTRIVADFNSMTRSGNWSVFFGVTSGDKAENGILLRYFENRDTFNVWFCNLMNREVETMAFADRRIVAELRSESLTINGASYPIKTEGAPCNGSIYIFCGNNDGSAWRPQAMRLYSFRIYDLVDGEEKLVRDYVPFRTTDGSMVVGLYDRVTQALCINQSDDGTLVLGRGGKTAVADNWFTGIAEGLWKDLGIGNVAIHEPCAEGGSIIRSRIEIDTTEGLFLRKFCDFEPDQEFADVLSYLPYDALAVVKIDSDLLWTEDTETNLRDYLPGFADLLQELRTYETGLRDDIVGGMYACVVADDAAKTTGMGATFGFGVKGEKTWNQLISLMGNVGTVESLGEHSVRMSPGGTIWGLLGVGHELYLDLVEKDGKSLICGYSSETIRQICKDDLATGRTLASNDKFLNRANPLLNGRDPSRTLRGFAYATPDFITRIGNASGGLLKLLFDCCGLTDCWDFSIVETKGDRIFVTSRMSQSVSDFYELALWLGADFAGNIVPAISETVKFDRDYGPSESAKGHFDFILGLLRIGRKALGITGLDYRYQDETTEGRSAAEISEPEVSYAASMSMVKTDSDSATLFKMIAAGEAGTICSDANVAERYLPADALAAVAFQPDYEAVMDVGRYLLDLAGRKDVANSLDVVCASGAGKPSCSAAFFGDMGLLLVSRIGTLDSFKKMANSFGDVWGALQQDESDQNLWYYVRTEGNKGQRAMRLAFHAKEGMLIYATSEGLLRQALAAGLNGENRLCASDGFKRAMGTGAFPAHNTLTYCAEGCVNSYAQWTADILSGSFSSDSVKRILGRDVLDLNACGYGVKGDDNIYRHYVRMRKDSHDALMTVAQAAFDAAGEGLQRVCPYDGSVLHGFDSGVLSHSIAAADENGRVTDNLIWSEARSGWTFVDNRTEVSDWRTMDPGRPRTFEDGRSLVLSSRAVFSRRADADGSSGDLSIAFDTETSGQTCEGGELKQDENDDSLWVLTPNAGRDTVMLGGLPDGAELQVKIGEHLIPGGVFKGFRNDNSSIFSLALNPEGVVGETPVRPVVGEFAIDAAGATLRFRTIGGLYYELVRAVGGFDLGRIENGIGLIGDGEAHVLQDTEKIDDPQGGVFYSLRVSLPGVQSDSGTAE